jgi:hypothetical protein
LVGTIRGLRVGEVHFPIQWLFEEGYKRDEPKFRAIVLANFAIAGALIVIAVLHLVTLQSELSR